MSTLAVRTEATSSPSAPDIPFETQIAAKVADSEKRLVRGSGNAQSPRRTFDLRDALRPSPANVPAWAAHLPYTKGTILEKPRAIPFFPGVTPVKTLIETKRRPVYCIFCRTSQKMRSYDVCANCYNFAKNEAERAYLALHPEVREMDAEEQEAILAGLQPFPTDRYNKHGVRADRESVEYSLLRDPHWNRASEILAARLKRAQGIVGDAETFTFYARSDRNTRRDTPTHVEVYQRPQPPMDLSEGLAPFTRTDLEIENREGMYSEGTDYDGHFEDPESQVSKPVHYRSPSPELDPERARQRSRSTSTMCLGTDRVAFLHELDTNSPYLDNAAIDTDLHAAAIAEYAERFPPEQPIEMRGGWFRTRTRDICPKCWKGNVNLLERDDTRFYSCGNRECDFKMEPAEYAAFQDPNDQEASAKLFPGFMSVSRKPLQKRERRRSLRSAKPTNDAQISAWDREVDEFLKKGKIAMGGLLEDAGVNAEDHSGWAREHRGEILPNFADEPPYVRMPHPHLLQERMYEAFHPWGYAHVVSGEMEITTLVRETLLSPGPVESLSDLADMLTTRRETRIVEDNAIVWTHDLADATDAHRQEQAERRYTFRQTLDELRERDHRKVRRKRRLDPEAYRQHRLQVHAQREAERAALRPSIRAALKKREGILANLERQKETDTEYLPMVA